VGFGGFVCFLVFFFFFVFGFFLTNPCFPGKEKLLAFFSVQSAAPSLPPGWSHLQGSGDAPRSLSLIPPHAPSHFTLFHRKREHFIFPLLPTFLYFPDHRLFVTLYLAPIKHRQGRSRTRASVSSYFPLGALFPYIFST